MGSPLAEDYFITPKDEHGGLSQAEYKTLGNSGADPAHRNELQNKMNTYYLNQAMAPINAARAEEARRRDELRRNMLSARDTLAPQGDLAEASRQYLG